MKSWELIPVCITIGAFTGVLLGLSLGHPRAGAAVGAVAALLLGGGLEWWRRRKEAR